MSAVKSKTSTKSAKKTTKPQADTQLTLPEPAAVVPEAPAVIAKPASNIVAVDFLRKSCMEVTIEISWLSTSKQIEKVMAARMLNAVDASAKSVSLSKRLFDSKHPAVKAANAAKSAIIAYRDSMTVPVAAVPPEGATDPKAFLMKEPGSRLILTELVDEFTEKMAFLVSNLKQAVSNMNDQLTSIKESDKANLKDLYNEEDYPESITELISVRGPSFRTIDYTLDFERLAPKTCARAVQQLQNRLSGTVDLAAADFSQALLTVTSQVANQLSNRVRLMPPRGHALQKYRDAEVTEYRDHSTHPDEIEEGLVTLEVRYMPTGTTKNITEWLEPMPLATYEDIKMETNERKMVYATSIDNLQSKLNGFTKISCMLGEPGKPIAAAVESLNLLLKEGGNNSEALLKEMRDSGSFRKRLNTEMQKINDALSSHITGLIPMKPKRRAIGKIKAKSDDTE